MKNLKIILSIMLVVFVSNEIFSQNAENVEDHRNDKMNKFEGTWQWQSGDSLFVIILKKNKLSHKDTKGKTDILDVLIGWHEFSVNGVIIESSLQYTEETDNKNTRTLIGGVNASDKLIKRLSFNDLSKSKLGKASLELLPGEKDLVRWTLKETPGVKVLLPGEEPDYTFTVPTDVIMRRIKKKNK